ncbi:hypothetical protein [Microbacterium sp. NPDC058345]|uniref:hypothetical protein n=1 Tax=Microbacterium sp. NPDC058345 TaxID=3346455 RepID=UPI00365B7D4F
MQWGDWATAGGTVWFCIALTISGLAGIQGRSKLGWFVAGMFLGPLALLILVVMTAPVKERDSV